MDGKSFTKLSKVLGVLLLLLAIFSLPSVHAEVPKLINFEGKLTEKDGTPISGTKTITFRIYDSADTKRPIWVETRDVTIDNGFYSILLGSVEPFPSSMKFDTKYWLSVQVSGEDEMSPRYEIGAVPYAINADMVDGKDLTEIVPRGVIVMWRGTIDSIPSGWHLCDGTNGTPNLLDKFILGVASGAENPGETGGSHNRTLTEANLPAHTHGEAGNHYHTFGIYYGGTVSVDAYAHAAGSLYGMSNTSAAGAHTHASVGSGTAFDNRPAYYKLAYIMKL